MTQQGQEPRPPQPAYMWGFFSPSLQKSPHPDRKQTWQAYAQPGSPSTSDLEHTMDRELRLRALGPMLGPLYRREHQGSKREVRNVLNPETEGHMGTEATCGTPSYLSSPLP